VLLLGCEPSSSPATASPADATSADASTGETSKSTSDTADATEPEASVKPGINDSWKSDDVAPLVDRLESETREVFAHRTELADLVAPKPGTVVADVGSGSGFMTQELAQRVGADGKVFAVDINDHLLAKVKARVEAAGLSNVETVLTSDRGVGLDPESVDLMFICDTYHHFEYPKTVLESIRRVLKPGAEIVIVDFDKIEGETEDWIMEHVRASKEEVTAELTEAGFELVTEHDLPALEKNYVLRFRKPAG
jgi:ubiquinone/menaquinone biosynthesis C-methylase UbiE